MAKKSQKKVDLSSHEAEAPVRNNKGRRYLAGAMKTLRGLPANISNKVQSNKALAKLRSITQDFDLEKAEECIDIMIKQEGNADIQALGCASLASISIQESTGLMQLGVIDALLKAMENHPKSRRVQASASLLVWNLAVKDEHKKILAKNGITGFLVNALEIHEKDQPVQHMAIGAMKILANDKKLKTRLADEGGIELVLKAMKRFRKANDQESRTSTAQMMETCISALQNFAFGNECVRFLMQARAGKYIIEAMDEYADDSEVQASACGALWNLSIAKENKLELAQMGASAAVARALKSFAENESVALNALGAMKNLSIQQDCLHLLVSSADKSQLIETLENCLVVHGDHSDINRIGVELLDILYEYEDDVEEGSDEQSVVNIDE